MQRMHLGQRLLVLVLGLVVAVGLAAPAHAHAQEVTPTTRTLSGPREHADQDTRLALDLLREDGTPVPGAQVLVERRTRGVWGEVALVATDEMGHAELDATLSRRADDNVFRASYAGDHETAPAETGPVPISLIRRSTRLTVTGPDQVVDEQSVPVRIRWVTGNGTPVPGVVKLFRRNGAGDWRVDRKLRTGDDGRAEITVTPRVDTRWKARARRLDWAEGDRSPVHRIDNLPPGIPVRLPKAAPKPRINLPDQPHAVGQGPNPVIRPIPQRVWNQMTGRSWHAGCPVGRASLRYLRINYWDFRGYRHRGELVAHADAIGKMANALSAMYRKNLPIRSMYRVDRFGWSKRLRGADDYRSMAADNTSAFNCRGVVGNPSVRSPHSYGRSLDLNPWENPYRSRQGTVPNTWWPPHSHARVAWRSRSHAVVQTMANHGLRWTYGTSDAHHFDAGGGHARMVARWGDCGGVVCK